MCVCNNIYFIHSLSRRNGIVILIPGDHHDIQRVKNILPMT